MIYKTVKTNGLSLQLKSLPPKPQPPSPKPPSPPTFLKSMQSSVSLPSANILSLGISHQCTFLHYNTTYHKCHIYRQTQVTLISSVSEKWTPCNLKYVTLPWCVLEHLTRSPKYVTPPRSLTFLEQKMPERLWYRHQSDKNAIAAEIERRSGNLEKSPVETFSIPKLRWLDKSFCF